MNLEFLYQELQHLHNPQKAKILSGFFKTGKGDYGEGDLFLGIPVPKQRTLSKKYSTLTFSDLEKLLSNKIHEHRFTALLILTSQYNKANDVKKEKIFQFYLKNIHSINNWDLVDLSAPLIVGNYLLHKDKKILYKLAQSQKLWERRIAIVSTLTFIRHNQFKDTLKISELLLKDTQDLLHKATGWMLREVGKKNEKTLEEFLNKHHHEMPRTMLRYTIERLTKEKKEYYMGKKIDSTRSLFLRRSTS